MVAVLHGAVVGGGLELAAAAHVRVAERSAYYALPEGSRGIYVGGGGSVRLPRLIGVARMMDMMLTGRTYSAEEGQAIGLTTYLVEPGKGFAKGLELAHTHRRQCAAHQLRGDAGAAAHRRDGSGQRLRSRGADVGDRAGRPEAKARLKDFLEKRAPKVTRADSYCAPTSIRKLRPAPVRLGPPDAVVERRPTASSIIRATQPLGAYHDKLSEPLEHWAKAAPDRVFLAQRDAQRRVAHADLCARCWTRVQRIGAALLRRGLSAERPIAIISGNDIEHALLALAAMYVGIPYAPISPAYSLLSSDFGKLRAIIDLLTPGLVFANDGGAVRARAIAQTVPDDIELVVTRNPPGDRKATLFADLLGAEDAAGVAAAHAQGHARHHRQIPVHLRLDRPAQGGRSTPSACCARTRRCSPPAFASSPTSRRWWWTGCRGATPSAATTTSTWCWSTAARFISTTAIRRRRACRRPRAICARSRRPSISTCRRVTRRWCRISAPTRRLRTELSSAG